MLGIESDERKAVANSGRSNERIGNANAAIVIMLQEPTGAFGYVAIDIIRCEARKQLSSVVRLVRVHPGIYLEMRDDRYTQTNAATKFAQKLHRIRVRREDAG